MTDVPPWMRAHAKLISIACVALLIVTAILQVVGDDESPWLPLGAMYFSAAVLGLDAMARGVRKKVGRGPSIANLAPGGWAIFTAMFWLVAVPAYYFGARRRVSADDDAREPVQWGSWVAITAFGLLGLALACVPLVK